MQHKAQAVELVMTAAADAEHLPATERWPAPVATAFIVGTSLALWAGIFLAAGLVLG